MAYDKKKDDVDALLAEKKRKARAEIDAATKKGLELPKTTPPKAKKDDEKAKKE